MGTVRSISIAALIALTVPFGPALPAHAAPPGNDDFASATAIPALAYVDTVSTAQATLETGEPMPPCGANVGKTVWYSFTPVADGALAANTLGSSFDTVLSVWTGSGLGDLDLVACNDDTADSLQSRLAF